LEGAGISLAKQYTAVGLTLTRTHANMNDGTPGGSVSVEAGLMDMLDRMQTGKFKVQAVPPQGRQGCEALRRPHGRHSVRGDDAA
jgi:hypothetical protein